jgi:Acetyltransferase (GNAT) domain
MLALSETIHTAIGPAPERSSSRLAASGPVTLNPLASAAWDGLVATHADATFFHTTAWARVLNEAYGHIPAYFVGRGAGAALLPIMEVNSPWLGRRGVSLPFTDWCPALGAAPELFGRALEHGRARGWRYFETRGGVGPGRDTQPSVAFHGHSIDLTVGEARLFDNLEASVRRGIRKATASPLRIEHSATLETMREYYALHCRTRRRQGVPPQPWRFFEAIARHALAAGHGAVISARLDGRMVAGAVFLHHGVEAIYKFGASDSAFQEHRPNNLIMWEAIRHYAARGCRALHLGRTSLANEGLRRFKLGFGAREERLEYFRYDYSAGRFVAVADRAHHWMNGVFRALPLPLLRLLGARLYPHLA